jgi:hypothetical protein
MQPTHYNLLQAIFLSGDPAIAAWEQWQRQADFDHLDWETFQLLPMLHQNLMRQQVRHPLMTRMHTVKQMFWSGNQVARTALEQILESLRQAEVEPALLGRVALAMTSDRLGVRSLSQLDLQVPLAQSQQAIQQLQALGWRSRAADAYSAFQRQTSLWLYQDNQPEIRLHHHFAPCCPSTELMQHCWNFAIVDATGSMRLWTATDQLLHLAVQWGLERSSVVSLADAILLIQTQEIDGFRLLETASHYRLLAPLQALMRELKRLDQPLLQIAPVIEQFSLPSIERWEQELVSHPAQNLWVRGIRRFARHHRERRISGHQASLVSFIRSIAQ